MTLTKMERALLSAAVDAGCAVAGNSRVAKSLEKKGLGTVHRTTGRFSANVAGRKQAASPIMVECSECRGCGEAQARCASCDVPLTSANQADCGSEGLAEDCCQECWDEDEDFGRLLPTVK